MSKVKICEPDRDGESSEEEELVYLNFDTILDSELLQPETPFKLIGLEEDQPILQLGSQERRPWLSLPNFSAMLNVVLAQVFAGNWRDTLGTAVFLADDPSTQSGDPVFTKNPSKMLCYHSKTRKMLCMSRVFINPKEGVNVNSETTNVEANSSENSSIMVTEEEPCCSYSVPEMLPSDPNDGTY